MKVTDKISQEFLNGFPSDIPKVLSIVILIIAMMKHGKKKYGEERVHLAYSSTSQSITEGSPDRNTNREGT